MSDTNVTIKRTYYETLKHSHDLLIALQECGVDNWEGYSEAVRQAFLDGDDVEED